MKYIFFSFFIYVNLMASAIDINSGRYERVEFNENELSFEFDTKFKDIRINPRGEYTWIRINKSFVLPKLNINIESTENYTYKYLNQKHYSQTLIEKKYTHFFVSPFLSDEIEVYEKGSLKGTIKIKIRDYAKLYSLDKSCNKTEIRVENKNKEPLLIGCSFHTKNDSKVLKIQFMHINSKAIKESYLDSKSILEYNEEMKNFKIQAIYKTEIKNFVLALGIGPYALHTSLNEKSKDATSAAIMLYSNYKFTQDVSVRAFSASIFDVSSFHNIGIYLANNFAYLLDSDLVFTSLLGVQYLDYRFNSNSDNYNSPLYPQGLEFTYRNLFKNKSYIISGGIFINPTSSSDYQNAWVRWGDKYFYELNYINWASDEFKANMWGLSLIFPFR